MFWCFSHTFQKQVSAAFQHICPEIIPYHGFENFSNLSPKIVFAKIQLFWPEYFLKLLPKMVSAAFEFFWLKVILKYFQSLSWTQFKNFLRFLKGTSKTCLRSKSRFLPGITSETFQKFLSAAFQQRSFHVLLRSVQNLF